MYNIFRVNLHTHKKNRIVANPVLLLVNSIYYATELYL